MNTGKLNEYLKNQPTVRHFVYGVALAASIFGSGCSMNYEDKRDAEITRNAVPSEIQRAELLTIEKELTQWLKDEESKKKAIAKIERHYTQAYNATMNAINEGRYPSRLQRNTLEARTQ